MAVISLPQSQGFSTLHDIDAFRCSVAEISDYLAWNKTGLNCSHFRSAEVARNLSGNSFRGQLAGLILPVNQAADALDHRVHLVGVALGNHQGQCDKGCIGDALRSVRPVKDSIVLHEPEEERGCDSFVAVNEGVVLDDKI